MAIARYFGVSEDCMRRSLPAFKALPHRLEYVADINGVRWYNDSIATTPESTMVALDAFTDPVVLIAGGYDKGLPFDALGRKITETAKAVVLLGHTAQAMAGQINRFLKTPLPVCLVSSLEEAVEKACCLTESGDVVVLSPACASYDMFDNFQERGRMFVEAVKALKESSHIGGI
jgi:UDP-N-acetylmuramoylalanine--D-glutamate ligase